jgi:hypothetical protein
MNLTQRYRKENFETSLYKAGYISFLSNINTTNGSAATPIKSPLVGFTFQMLQHYSQE